MNIANKIAAAVLIFGTTLSAMAGSYYGALDIGQTKAKDTCSYLSSVGTVGCEDTSTLYRIGGGYQFTPMWGTEVSYATYGKESLGTFGGFPLGDWKMDGLQISGIGTLPVGAGFDLIGKVGIARTKYVLSYNPAIGMASDSATKTKLAYGIGAQYNISPRFAVRAQYEDLGEVGEGDWATCVACTGTTEVQLMSLGAVLKF